MKPFRESSYPGEPKDRIEGNKIILNARGQFPKEVIVIDLKEKREYRLVQTKKGGYQLT